MKQSKGVLRMIVETTVRKALNDLGKDPERTIRNLVEIAHGFSKGEFQKNFFQIVQSMLENEDSAYYLLVKNLVYYVDHETLLTFGMNLGYNGCANGSKKMRQAEEEYGFHVPWSMCFCMKEGDASFPIEQSYEIIEQGKTWGAYTYFFFSCDEQLEEISQLVESEPDCAFLIFIDPQKGKEAQERFGQMHNVMIFVRGDCPNSIQTAKYLVENKMLVGAYRLYSSNQVSEIETGAWLKEISSSGAAMAFLAAEKGCSQEERKEVWSYIRKTRFYQDYPIIPVEFSMDMITIDQAFSPDTCSLHFSPSGQVTLYDKNGTRNLGLYSCGTLLQQLLGGNMQKTTNI
jgi:hypothetical protein